MCQVTNYKIPNPRIDKCMIEVIKHLKSLLDKKYKTIGCCCGHGKYNITIIVQNKYGTNLELFSGKIIPRKRNFYRRDKNGYYYIPEVNENVEKNI